MERREKLLVIIILLLWSAALGDSFLNKELPTSIFPQEGDLKRVPLLNPKSRSSLIGPVGDIRAVLGSAGKNITNCLHGDVVAVIYGGFTGNPNNPMQIMVAYSLDSGATWVNWGPFSPSMRRLYPGLDAMPNFCNTSGSLLFVWQESPYGYNQGDIKTMIEENIPAAPAFSTLFSLPQGTQLWPWFPCIGIAPDNPMHVMVSAWSYLLNGDLNIYVWISEDGGYTWSDTIPVVAITNPDSGCTGHFRFGTGGYVAFTYHNSYNGIEWPFLIESTDGGYTWLSPTPLPVPYYYSGSQFWWYEMDLEVIENEPWTVHTDLGTDSMWLFYPAGGGPGNWVWSVKNVRQLSWDSTWCSDTLYLCYAVQYPSIAYDQMSGLVLIAYKAYYYRGDTITWNDYNGAHIGGIYTIDHGETWQISAPLSTPNTGQIPWFEMTAVEVSHRLVNIEGVPYPRLYSYGIWIFESEMNLYFDRGWLRPWITSTGILEMEKEKRELSELFLAPSIAEGKVFAKFYLCRGQNVSISIFDIMGRMVKSVFEGHLNKGEHRLSIDLSDIPGGTYFLILKTKDKSLKEKIICIRQ